MLRLLQMVRKTASCVEVTGVTGDSINQLGWASVCTMVDCRRPSNLTCEFYDEQGRCSTDTICCYECATGEGHSAACDATAADAEDDGDWDGGSTAGYEHAPDGDSDGGSTAGDAHAPVQKKRTRTLTGRLA